MSAQRNVESGSVLVRASDLLIEHSPNRVEIIGANGRLIEMNRNGQRLLGIRDFATWQDRPWIDLWLPENRDEVLCALQAATEGQTTAFIASGHDDTGALKHWSASLAPIHDNDGRIRSVLSIANDVTAQHEAERQHRLTVARLQFVLDTGRIGDWELDFESEAIVTSPLFAAALGHKSLPTLWPYEQMLAQVMLADRDRISRLFRHAIQTKTELELKCEVFWPDESQHWVEIRAGFYTPAPGRPTRMIGTIRDISDTKWMEEEMREITAVSVRSAREAEAEKQRFYALLESTPVGIAYARPGGAIEASNHALIEAWGMGIPTTKSLQEYDGYQAWWADGSSKHGQRVTGSEWPMVRALAGEEVRDALMEIRPFNAPDTRRTLLMHAAPVRDSRGDITGAVLVQQDLTERVAMEDELRKSEMRFRTITDAMPQMVWSANALGKFDYFNHRWFEFTGIPVDEIIGEAYARVFHPNDLAQARVLWQHAVQTGEVYENRHRIRHHDGTYRWVLARAVPVLSENGVPVRWMGTCTDIHEQYLAQEMLRRNEQKLREADRRKDEFLAMLAHELRNPLAPISAAAEVVRRAQSDATRVEQASKIITRQVVHMAGLVDDLLDVSRVTRGLVHLNRSVFDLKEAIRTAEEQARPLIESRRHSISMRLGAESLYVDGDRARLVQAVVNVLTNAAKYTPVGGRIDVEASKEDGMITVSIKDNGIGIDAKLKPAIFDLFAQGDRTPDRAQGGLGIGLPLVRSLLHMHGGSVEAYSEGPDLGSEFVLRLPEAAAAAPAMAEVIQYPKQARRVVLVDDNPDVIASVSSLLEVEGHTVQVFLSAEEALEVSPATVDVFVIDIGLPGITGHELVRRLRTKPGGDRARYFAMSGYGQAHDVRASLDAGIEHHFVKPVDTDELLSRIARPAAEPKSE